MSSKKDKDKPTKPIPEYLILREVLRHYLEYRDLAMAPSTSKPDGKSISSVECDHGVIDYGYYIYDEEGNKKDKIEVTLSFWDLLGCLRPQSQGGLLSDRKREAIFYNVILDKKQQDVADIMRITPVSVGQYVEQGCIQIAQELFNEKEKDEGSKSRRRG